jgi:hypothetical protein
LPFGQIKTLVPACRRAPQDREDRSRIDMIYSIWPSGILEGSDSARVPAPRALATYARTATIYLVWSLSRAGWTLVLLDCYISRRARSHAIYGLVSVVCHRRRLSALIDLIASTESSSTVQLRRPKSHGGTGQHRDWSIAHRRDEQGPWPACCLERRPPPPCPKAKGGAGVWRRQEGCLFRLLAASGHQKMLRTAKRSAFQPASIKFVGAKTIQNQHKHIIGWVVVIIGIRNFLYTEPYEQLYLSLHVIVMILKFSPTARFSEKLVRKKLNQTCPRRRVHAYICARLGASRRALCATVRKDGSNRLDQARAQHQIWHGFFFFGFRGPLKTSSKKMGGGPGSGSRGALSFASQSRGDYPGLALLV